MVCFFAASASQTLDLSVVSREWQLHLYQSEIAGQPDDGNQTLALNWRELHQKYRSKSSNKSPKQKVDLKNKSQRLFLPKLFLFLLLLISSADLWIFNKKTPKFFAFIFFAVPKT